MSEITFLEMADMFTVAQTPGFRQDTEQITVVSAKTPTQMRITYPDEGPQYDILLRTNLTATAVAAALLRFGDTMKNPAYESAGGDVSGEEAFHPRPRNGVNAIHQHIIDLCVYSPDTHERASWSIVQDSLPLVFVDGVQNTSVWFHSDRSLTDPGINRLIHDVSGARRDPAAVEAELLVLDGIIRRYAWGENTAAL